MVADPLSRMFAPSEMANGKSGSTPKEGKEKPAVNEYGGINVEIVKPYFFF